MRTKKHFLTLLVALMLACFACGATLTVASTVKAATTYNVTNLQSTRDAKESNNLYFCGAIEGEGITSSWEVAYSGKVKLNSTETAATLKQYAKGDFYDFYINGFGTAEVGDVLTIYGEFSNESCTFSFEETYFKWNGTAWSSYKQSNVTEVTPAQIGAWSNTALYAMGTLTGSNIAGDWVVAYTGIGTLGSASTNVQIKLIKDPSYTLYIEGFGTAAVGDVLTFGGEFKNAAGTAVLAFEETKLLWNGSAWSVYSEKPVYNVTDLKATSDAKNNNNIYFWGLIDGEVGATSDWEIAYSGKVKLNSTEIDVTMKYIGKGDYYTFFIEGFTATDGDILTIDGEFSNDSYTFAFEQTSFKWDGSAWSGYVEKTVYNVTDLIATRDAKESNNLYFCGAIEGEVIASSWTVAYSGKVKLNSTEMTVTLKQYAKGDFYDFYINGFGTAEVGDVLTIYGEFSNESCTFSFEETAFRWDGSAWSVYTGPEIVNYIVTDLMTTKDAVNANNLYFCGSIEGEMGAVSSWAVAYSGKAKLNSTEMTVTLKQYAKGDAYDFFAEGFTATDGDILEIGGEYSNPDYGYTFVIERTKFIWDGSAWSVYKVVDRTFTEGSVFPSLKNGTGNIFAGWMMNGAIYKAGAIVPADGTAEAVYIEFALENGAEIRLQSDLAESGIRFKGVMKEESFNEYGEFITAIGIIVLPTDLIGEADFEIGHTGDPADFRAPKKNFSFANGEMIAYCTIKTIRESNYNRSYSGRAYAEIAYADGTTGVVYGSYLEENNARTVYYVAAAGYAAIADESLKAILTAYMSKVASVTLKFINNVQTASLDNADVASPATAVTLVSLNDSQATIKLTLKDSSVTPLLLVNGEPVRGDKIISSSVSGNEYTVTFSITGQFVTTKATNEMLVSIWDFPKLSYDETAETGERFSSPANVRIALDIVAAGADIVNVTGLGANPYTADLR